jgi:hypothetical protein
MDDQRNCPTDDTDNLRLILLQLEEAGRQEVYAMIRDLADKAGVPEQPATVAELFEQWKDLWRQADAAPDDAAVNAIADRAFLIEQRAVICGSHSGAGRVGAGHLRGYAFGLG